MKRTLIQFNEDTYHKLRHRAFAQGRSVSAVVREMVVKELEGPAKRKKYAHVEDFSFVGAGSSKQGRLAPVSERHDEVLAEVYGTFKRVRTK